MEETPPTLDAQPAALADAQPVEMRADTQPMVPEAEPEPLAAGAKPEPVALTDSATVVEGPGQATMTELVDEFAYQRPQRGEIRPGIILSIDPEEVIVDVGVKRDGVVPMQDLNRLSKEEREALAVGDQVLVYVLRPEDREGNLLLSLHRARQEKDWRRAEDMLKSGDVLEARISGYNKGGIVVPFGGIRGFVPASQINGFPRHMAAEERLKRLSELVGREAKLVIIEVDRRRRRLVLSERIAARRWRKSRRKELLDNLREGEVATGTVSSLASFGAFVDLGGADGLVHVSELSWRRVRHPREVVQVGQEVQVLVLRLDQKRQRIALSLKRLQPEPWATVEDRYELGQLTEGVITNVTDFGAFAEIEEGVEGLVHISELAETNIGHPNEVVKRGDLLLLRIIRIDPRRRRMGLSLKRVLASEWTEWAARLNAAREAEEAAAPAVTEPTAEPSTAVEEPMMVASEDRDLEPHAEAEPEALASAEPDRAEAEPEALASAEPDRAVAEPEVLASAEPDRAEAEPEALASAEPDRAVAEPEVLASAEPDRAVAEPEVLASAEPDSAVAEPTDAVASAEREAADPPTEVGDTEPAPEALAPEATPPDEADVRAYEDQALSLIEA